MSEPATDVPVLDADARHQAINGLYERAPKLDEVPVWARPSRVGDQDAFSTGHALLFYAGRQSDTDLLAGRERLAEGWTRRALQLGAAAGITGEELFRQRLYCGLPLFAAHVAAEALRRNALAGEDPVTADLIGRAIQEIWPTPASVRPPSVDAIRAGGLLHRHVTSCRVRPRNVEDVAVLAIGGGDVRGPRLRTFIRRIMEDAPRNHRLSEQMGRAVVALALDG